VQERGDKRKKVTRKKLNGKRLPLEQVTPMGAAIPLRPNYLKKSTHLFFQPQLLLSPRCGLFSYAIFLV
jgi:hypothetical protein